MPSGKFSPTPLEIEETIRRIEKHQEEIEILAKRYELTLTEEASGVLYDPRFLTESEVSEIVEKNHLEKNKVLSSMIRKQFLVVHACRIRKESPSWQHESEARTNLNGGFTSEMRMKRGARTLGLGGHTLP